MTRQEKHDSTFFGGQTGGSSFEQINYHAVQH